MLMNAQLNSDYEITTVQSGFDFPMQQIFVDDFTTITAEIGGNIYVSDNFVARTTPIISRTPNTDGEGGQLSILYKKIDSVDYLWIYDTVEDAPNYGNISLYIIDLDSNDSTFVDDIFSAFFHTSFNHQGGTLMWHDGWLYLGFGDSNNRWFAQRDSRNNGKIIRIDPFTGNGHPDNPLYNSIFPNSAESIQYAKGIRNPYRIVMNNDGVILCADVGSQTEEEITAIEGPGMNLEWPFFEGYDEIFYQGGPPTNPDTGQPYELSNSLKPMFSVWHNTTTAEFANGTIDFDFPYDPFAIISLAILDDFGYPGELLFMDVYQQNLMVCVMDDDYVATELVNLGELGFSGVTSATQYNGNIYLTKTNGSIVKIEYTGTLNVEDFEFNDVLAKKTFYILGTTQVETQPKVGTTYLIKYEFEGREQWKKRIYTNQLSLSRLD